MKIDYAAKVDIGIRETNDDRVLVDGNILDRSSCSGEAEIPLGAVVCDGCGGYLGGNIAAQTVLEVLSHETPSSLCEKSHLAQVLADCERSVNERKKEMPQFAQMCTTIAGCIFCRDSILIFHSGDSRVYRHDQWGIARMTWDHSVVQNMVDMGEITPEEALTHPKRNIITRCIGIGGLSPEIYVAHCPLLPGEKYLLCSDGLWESVPESQMIELLSKDLPLQEIVDQLVQRALQLGADDNISVCICSARGRSNV